jgi:hypothetical protein
MSSHSNSHWELYARKEMKVAPSTSLPTTIFWFTQELAELVHKVHLLCLIARGRVVDKACNDTLIQVRSSIIIISSNLFILYIIHILLPMFENNEIWCKFRELLELWVSFKLNVRQRGVRQPLGLPPGSSCWACVPLLGLALKGGYDSL